MNDNKRKDMKEFDVHFKLTGMYGSIDAADKEEAQEKAMKMVQFIIDTAREQCHTELFCDGEDVDVNEEP